MFSFIKKLLGLPTEEEKKQALESKNEVPYKVEPVEQHVVNNKSGEVVDLPKSTVQTVVTEEVVIKQTEPVKDIEPKLEVVQAVKAQEPVKMVEPVKAVEPKLEVVKPVVEEKPSKKTKKSTKSKAEKEKGTEKSVPEKVKKSKSKKI